MQSPYNFNLKVEFSIELGFVVTGSRNDSQQ